MCLFETKYICVMADYYSTGVWDANGNPIELEEIPIPVNIKHQLRQMICDYEHQIDAATDSGASVEILFSARSYEIAKLIKTELKSWTITFFNFSGCIPLKTHYHRSEVL